MRTDFDHAWQSLTAEILSRTKEWRLAHPRATFNEMETALDERLARLWACMLQDVALASAAAEWDGNQDVVLCCSQRGMCPKKWRPMACLVRN